MYIAKDIGNTPFYSGSADFNQIDPPKGNLEGFADEIYRYANNFDRHSQPEKGEYIVGKFDGVAWVNSIFKKAGVSDAVRQKGGGRISPHPNMFDPMVFDLPTASAPGFIYPTDPMILAPGHRLHTIVEGDSLSKIAFNYYRDYQKWEKIYHYIDPHYRDWNKVKIGANPNLIFPGTKIIIPPLNAIL
ncbi:MAG: LysM peptidoglycan-binding domain-containing protein [Pyrinomonadaceae bacterium]